LVKIESKLIVLGIMVSVTGLLFGSVASAHVVVRPAEVLTAGFHTFTVGVPNEKEIPTVSVELVMPSGLNNVKPTQKSGWTIEIEREGEGLESPVKSVTWLGNNIEPGLREEFSFSAQAPAEQTELNWKAYQAYSDGSVVAWDQDPSSANTGQSVNPYSITKVVSTSNKDASSQMADSSAGTSANRAFYVALSALIVSFLALFLSTKRK
jgi:uncharacterized protein YcnI